jgi:hypothetical protein
MYFQPAWSPDGHSLAALACKPDEWNARRDEDKTAAGRPRLIDLEGKERLLSDRLADAAPVWSPDASKVAVSFDTDVAIYDALGDAPTGADIPLRDALLAASTQYDAGKLSKKDATTPTNSNEHAATKTSASNASAPTPATDAAPLSFNPIVRLEWLQPETLLIRTAFVRLYKSGELITNYPRWHILHLSPQAAVLSIRQTPSRFHQRREPAPVFDGTYRVSRFPSRTFILSFKPPLRGASTL